MLYQDVGHSLGTNACPPVCNRGAVRLTDLNRITVDLVAFRAGRRLLTDQIWSQLNLLEPESVIVEIASERLVEKREASLVCPECGSEFWRADE